MPGADPALFTVEHPEQLPLAAGVERPANSELVVTGTVTPDIARNVPVVSLASGRIVAIHARLGDTVKKGQLLRTVRSDDVAGGFDAYRKAVADELLARKQINRATDLYAHGAIAEQDLEVAQDAVNNAKATFRGQTREMHTVVRASAVLHMHDRDFVFVPTQDKKFRRVEVVSGELLSDYTSMQEIKSGLKPGQQVVTNALVLDHVLAQ